MNSQLPLLRVFQSPALPPQMAVVPKVRPLQGQAGPECPHRTRTATPPRAVATEAAPLKMRAALGPGSRQVGPRGAIR